MYVIVSLNRIRLCSMFDEYCILYPFCTHSYVIWDQIILFSNYILYKIFYNNRLWLIARGQFLKCVLFGSIYNMIKRYHIDNIRLIVFYIIFVHFGILSWSCIHMACTPVSCLLSIIILRYNPILCDINCVLVHTSYDGIRLLFGSKKPFTFYEINPLVYWTTYR